jgi:pimeloyl-ACP methyl ester carboxylesterase
MLTSPWFKYFFAYDPRPTLENVKCPVLALNGDKDVQAIAVDNLPAIKSALVAGGIMMPA